MRLYMEKNDILCYTFIIGSCVFNDAVSDFLCLAWQRIRCNMKRSKGFLKKLSLTQVVYICIIVIVLAIVVRVGIIDKSSKVAISASSLLTNSLDIAELSTAEFKYRGIAEIYEDEARTRIRCRVCYNAIVKAGVNMDDVHVEVDSLQKTISVVLP